LRLEAHICGWRADIEGGLICFGERRRHRASERRR
jgi:hypothetical protein